MPKYKHGSVERNRLKRRLRELVRTRLLPVLPPADIVIKPWPQGYEASFESLTRDVERARGQIVKLFGNREPGAGSRERPTGDPVRGETG